MNFENKVYKQSGLYYSRIIASWNNSLQKTLKRYPERLRFIEGERGMFLRWLEHIGIADEDVQAELWEMKVNGKLELEIDAENFIKNYNPY